MMHRWAYLYFVAGWTAAGWLEFYSAPILVDWGVLLASAFAIALVEDWRLRRRKRADFS